MSRTTICATFVFFIFMGCKDNRISVITSTEPTEFRHALWPLAVGNSWTYLDSLFSDGGVSVETYTVVVSSYRFDNGFIWWQLEERRPSSTMKLGEIGARGDSIFSLQYNFQYPVLSLDYIPPSPTDTLHFMSLMGGDVSLPKSVWLNGVYEVPAGAFDSCASFAARRALFSFVEVLRPRVGIIQKNIQYESSIQRKVVLANYRLNQ